MNRNTRTLIVVAVAVVMASIASFGVYLAVRSIPERRVEIAQRQTLVAVHEIPVGTLLTPDDVKLVPWPAANPVPGSYVDVKQVVDRGVIATIAENEPVTDSKLAKAGSGGGLPPTIPEGMRAISVRVNEVVGVAGFVIPGTRVDVVVSIGANGGGDKVARVVVSNVQVLTAGTRFDQERARKDAKPIPTTVVTLLVTPDDAEKIALAADEGKIMLTLRNPLDTAPTQTNGARRQELLGRPAPPPVEKEVSPGRRVVVRAPAPPPAPLQPSIYRVETIRAAKRSEEEVR
jgi:pilus assembly protein CpaB